MSKLVNAHGLTAGVPGGLHELRAGRLCFFCLFCFSMLMVYFVFFNQFCKSFLYKNVINSPLIQIFLYKNELLY